MSTIACIYHKDCIDGTTAAAVVLEKFPDAHCFPVGHSTAEAELAEIFTKITPSDHLYIVDTAHGAERALSQGQKVVVLDHHISERARMHEMAERNPDLTYVFDNEKSGASLAWTYFFPDTPLPKLIAHVEDIDLWRKHMGDETDYVANYLSMMRNDPHTVYRLISTPIETIYERGALLTQNSRMEIERLVAIPSLLLTIAPYTVPAFNITNYPSDCGNILSQQLGKTVALYTIRGDIVRFSFRSLDAHTPSALDIAHALGGGGHRNASGATMPTRDFIKNLTL